MHQRSFLGKWVRSALIFPADSHSLSEDEKEKKEILLIIHSSKSPQNPIVTSIFYSSLNLRA